MSIQADDIEDTGLSDDDAVAQLMATLKPAKGDKPANAPEDDDQDEEVPDDEDGDEDDDQDEPDEPEGDDEEDSEGDGDEDGEGDDEGDQSKPNAPTAQVPDDAVVKVLVDGQETEFTVANLKRLAGQEAALTRKSQEADEVGGRAAIILQGALDAVLEDLNPYKDVDWVLEGQRMDPEEFAWHRETFTRLRDRYNALVKSAQDFDGLVTTKRQRATEEQASEALKVLQADIPGWSDKLYADIMAYGVAQGLNREDVESITSPAVLKIIRKAMLHDKGQQVATEKVNRTPKKVRKGSGREAVPAESVKQQRTLQKKIASGTISEDDAIAALVGRWGVKGK